MVGGIGGPGGAGKPPGVGGPDALSPGAVQGAEAPRASFGEVVAEKASAVSATGPLDQLRAGQIDLSQYVDLKVEEATKHLVGLLPPAEIERVQGELRDLIEHDPDVAALVKAAETAR